MATHHNQLFNDSALTKAALNKRLEESSWGFFLLMIGALLLLPIGLVPQGTWLIGAGFIMLVLNCVRHVNGISASGFTVGLGLVAILVGLTSFFGLRPPLFAIFLALIGLSIIVRSLLPPRVERRNV